MSVTEHLVELARGISLERVPADALAVAKHSILDWIGCTLAGSREPLSAILREELIADGGGGAAAIVGRPERARALDAALVNGAASHALDFDDTHILMLGHPTAPVLPAALAVGEELGASGAALLEAFVAGVEVECRLGAILAPGHYAVGWHSTATLGTFGAAAASARLLGLDAGGWRHAFGLAGTQAAGLKSVFGSMAKPLHAGKAAANGLLSARLAARGFTSATEIVEVAQGFAATHTATFAPERLAEIGGRFLVRDTVFKYHAACYLTHASIEGALRLREEARLDPADVERVEIHVPAGHLRVCNLPEPRTGLEGKFSLRATAAMALLGIDTARLESYADETMRDPRLVALRDRVEVTAARGLAEAESRIVVRAGGRTLERTVDTGIPAADLERQGARLAAKFHALADPLVGRARADEIEARVARLEDERTVADLAALCAGDRTPVRSGKGSA